MTIISRLKLDHPILGTSAGAGLHSSLESIYLKIGDSLSSRFFTIENLNDSTSVDCDHNFNTLIGNLRYDLYLWDTVTGEITLLTEDTTPTLASFGIIAKVGDTKKQFTVTNNSGAQRDLVLTVFNDPLELNELTDVDTAGKEDGQAMVYDLATKLWKPGASGDASFKLQSITDPNAILKGGYLMLPDGRELATYDGTGGASTDFGKDMTVNLDAILGGSPANATSYFLYIDLNTLGAVTVCSDNGRRLYAVTQANLVLSVTAPEAVNLNRYVARGVIRSATTGTVWSGAGATFATMASLRHDPLGSFFSYIEEKLDSATSAAIKTVTHGLSGRPNLPPTLEFVTFLTGKRTPLSAETYCTDNNTTTTVFDFSSLTFAASDRVEIGLYYCPRVSNGFVSSSQQYESPWFDSALPASATHGLADKFAIRAVSYLEWDVTAGTITQRECTLGLVTKWNDTTIYFDGTGITPSSTLKYKIVAGGSALPQAAAPVMGSMFEFTVLGQLASGSTAYVCSKMFGDSPTEIAVVQKKANGWQPVPIVDSIWVTADGNKYLRGDIDVLVPSVTEPVRITVR